jgi:streptogrisin C
MTARQSRRITVATVLLMLIASVGPVPATTLSADPATLPGLTEAIEGRTDLGLDAAPEFVSVLLGDPTSRYDYGMPMTPIEETAIAAQDELGRAAAPLLTYLDEHDDDFGGNRWDRSGDDLRLVVATTPNTTSEELTSVASLTPEGLLVQFDAVQHSLRSLRDSQARLRSDYDRLGVVESYPDVARNELHIVVLDDSVESELADLVAVPVAVRLGRPVETTACASRSNCTPYRGGIYLDSVYTLCTWGFNVREQLTNAKYLVTAGHCGKTGSGLKHNGITVSGSGGVNSDSYEFLGSANSDSMRAPKSTASGWSTPYDIIFADGVTARYIFAVKGSALQGPSVCFSGRTSGYKCGTIVQRDIDAVLSRSFVDGKTQHVYHMIRMSRTTSGGDSGGPVFQDNDAYGIVTASDPNNGNEMVYSDITYVQSDMKVWICTTGACP